MNKTAIQRFAVWARTELMAQVSQKAYQYGITKDGYGDANAVTVEGRALSSEEQRQRKELVEQIRRKGYPQVIEEVAYTWFNRFIALRFMEVNNYLPSHIRVFSDSTGAFKPEILSDAIHVELPGLRGDRVTEYIESNQTEELYRYLLLTQCNALNESLPRMFEKIGGYTELLFPNNILKSDSVLGRLVSDIPEEDWTDQVQIIGWLYQYYNSELKDETFTLLQKNVKITKERIPAATQLFTPDWIVRYMVENSLGRLWIDHLEGDQLLWGCNGQVKNINEHDATIQSLKAGWEYYLETAEQTPEIKERLENEKASRAELALQDIKLIDPCMGSGHILVYAFDVLMQIYTSAGWDPRDAVQSILTNNLYGLDIDDRAAQLAYFAVMMKARQYDRRIFSRGIQPHVYSIVESNDLDGTFVASFVCDDSKLKREFGTLLEELRDAKEYGSILQVSQVDFSALYARVEEIRNGIEMFADGILDTILPLIQVAEAMAQKYDIVVTNPPYMGSSGMGTKLSDYVKKNYPDSKSDLFAVFMERCYRMVSGFGYQAMITQHAWMFLSSYEKLRNKLLQEAHLVNMAHLGARAFEEIGGEVVQTTAFVLSPGNIADYKGTYCRLVDPTTQQGKEDMFLAGKNRYAATQTNFSKIPGSPIAYWVSSAMYVAFIRGCSLGDVAPTKKGLDTGENDKYLRYWFEVSSKKMGIQCVSSEDFALRKKKWAPHDKGGDFRRWYGNKDWVINWENNGYELHNSKANLRSEQYYFNTALTWGTLSSGKINFRLSDYGAISNTAGSSVYPNSNTNYLLALLNTPVTQYILDIISPTLNYSAGPVAMIPIMFTNNNCVEFISNICERTVTISKADWDSFETSWDFKRHPLV